jgi:hypothetical protein
MRAKQQGLKGGMGKLAVAVVAAAGCALGASIYSRWQVAPPPLSPPAPPRVAFGTDGVAAVRHSGTRFVASVETFRDELFAYMMLRHFRTTAPAGQDSFLLVYRGSKGQAQFEILLALSDDAIASQIAVAEAGFVLGHPLTLISLSAAEAVRCEKQTRFFDLAYNLPIQRKLEDLSRPELRALVRRFIRFKSTTDPRVRRQMEPIPKVLSPNEAEQLAGDMIAVAEFYALPLDYLLGIGAMENNYMNIRGDLQHSIWKRRPAKDDIILERRRGRARVLNDSAGVWQITRETLRYTHDLYLKDTRDYGQLPEHLRPPRTFVMNEVRPEILTTYAGLLLRNLLDRFDGDPALAVGAYNGGPANPNAGYEEGVRIVAGHARGLLERAAALNGESVLKRSWITSR